MPDATYVERVLMCMGERGLLACASALLWGRPKGWSFERPNDDEQRRRYVEAQYAAVLRSAAEYCGDVPVVLGVDIGHTDPQLVVPYGGMVTVDPRVRRITVEY